VRERQAQTDLAPRAHGLRQYVRDGWDLGGAALRLAVDHSELRRFAAIAYGSAVVVEILVSLTVIFVRHHLALWQRPFVLIGLAYLAALLSALAAVGLAGLSGALLEGGEVRSANAWKLIRRRLPQVAGWAAIVVVVGIPSRFLTGWGVDQLSAVLLGFGWAVLSFFAIPAIALRGDGPIAAGLRSLRLVGQRWGEQVVGMVYVWVRPTVFLGLPGAAAVVVGIVLDRSGHDLLGWTIAVAGGLVIAIAYLLIVAAQSILSVTLFRFAEGGEVHGSFDRQQLERVLRGPAPLVTRAVRRLESDRTRRLRERIRSLLSNA
jgi:hypothetical protein